MFRDVFGAYSFEVEYLASKEALEVLKNGKTYMRSFDLAPDQVASIGMICGGKVTIHYQIISETDLPILHQMREALAKALKKEPRG